jgi:hypothetical protein
MKNMKKVVAGVLTVAVLTVNAGAWEITERVKTGLKVAGAVAVTAVAATAVYYNVGGSRTMMNKLCNEVIENARNAKKGFESYFEKPVQDAPTNRLDRIGDYDIKVIEENAFLRLAYPHVKEIGGWEASRLTREELEIKINARLNEINEVKKANFNKKYLQPLI